MARQKQAGMQGNAADHSMPMQSAQMPVQMPQMHHPGQLAIHNGTPMQGQLQAGQDQPLQQAYPGQAEAQLAATGLYTDPSVPVFPDDSDKISSSYRYFGGAWKHNPRAVIPRKLKCSGLQLYKTKFSPMATANVCDDGVDEICFIRGDFRPRSRARDLGCKVKGDFRCFSSSSAKLLMQSFLTEAMDRLTVSRTRH